MAGKAITLQSSDPSDPDLVAATIIDGRQNGSVITCNNSEGTDTIISGFWITNGSGTEIRGDKYGGGMYNDNSSPIIENCTFSSNTSGSGGGMYNDNSSPKITNCTFSSNTSGSGGGMYNDNSSPKITNCTFSSNTSGNGGGMYNDNSSPTLENCLFTENTTPSLGGGVFNCENSNPTFTSCIFSNNSAGQGGGIGNWNTSPSVQDCTFNSNSVNISGGGLWNCENSNPTVENCSFTSNTAGRSGGGMYNEGHNPTITNCSFSKNKATDHGGAILNVGSSAIVEYCIFSENESEEGGGVNNMGGSPKFTGCEITFNTSTYSGGGIRNTDSTNVEIIDCIITDNVSEEGKGGGMYCEADTSVKITNTLFANNSPYNIEGNVINGGGNSMKNYTVGSDPDADFTCIQEAIDAAVDGMTVYVMPGTYYENINMQGKAITLQSSDPNNLDVVAATIINGGQIGSVITCSSGEGVDTIINGFVYN